VDSWWLIVHTPTGVHCHELGALDDQARDARIGEITASLPVPEDWLSLAGWQVLTSPGQPHPSLLQRATVHRLDDQAGAIS
jgi:hypothetical protein